MNDSHRRNTGLVRGAYGLALEAAFLNRADFVIAPEDWPSWRLEWSAKAYEGLYHWSPDTAAFQLHPQGAAVIDRKSRRTVLHLPGRPTPAEITHPYLASTAVAAANWRGDFVLHAGSFVVDGKVWAVVGEREAGKSSILAWLLNHGVEIASDDLLVTDGKVTRVGPRCVDLRRGAATRFGLGEYLGVIGNRERWRVALPPLDPELPLAGIVLLEWGSTLMLEPASLKSKVANLAPHRGLRLPSADGASALLVLALKFFTFTRAQDWNQMDSSMELLLESLRHVDSGS